MTFSATANSFNTSLYLAIFAIVTLATTCIFSVRGDILHPYMWFNIPFVLYSISAAIQYLFEGTHYSTQLLYGLELSFIAMVSFQFAVGRHRCNSAKLPINSKMIKVLTHGNISIFVMSLTIALVSLVAYLQSGMVNKMDRHLEFSPIYMMGFAFNIMNLCMCIFIISKCIEGKIKYASMAILLFFAFLILAFLVNGERGIIFKYVIVASLTFHVYGKRLPLKFWCLLLVVGLGLQVILGELKMYFLADATSISELVYPMYSKSLLSLLFSSELQTPSVNLCYLTESVPSRIPFHLGESILWDLQRAVVPGFLFPRELAMSTAAWFSETFFPEFWDLGGGVGFTLVGVGYLNFGMPGVILLFLFIGFIVRRLYMTSFENVTRSIIYICIIPLLISAIRADLSILISQSLKHVLLPLIIMLKIGRTTGKHPYGKIIMHKAIHNGVSH